jgi:predicted transglutaminase-like cysteine proteinase
MKGAPLTLLAVIALAACAATPLCDVSDKRLQQVNDWANAKPYIFKYGYHWNGLADFETNGGNCWGMTIAKMASLPECPKDSMNALVGYTSKGTPHALLEVRTTHGYRYLDNRIAAVTTKPRGFK